MKQANLAQLSGLNASEISRYVRGQRRPTAQALEILATALDIELAKLVAGTDVEDLIAPELQFVRRDQHEVVLQKLTEAQARVVELEERLKTKAEHVTHLNARLTELDDDRDAECEAKRQRSNSRRIAGRRCPK